MTTHFSSISNILPEVFQSLGTYFHNLHNYLQNCVCLSIHLSVFLGCVIISAPLNFKARLLGMGVAEGSKGWSIPLRPKIGPWKCFATSPKLHLLQLQQRPDISLLVLRLGGSSGASKEAVTVPRFVR